ncbi:MAG: diguanylate cyclase [Selenomonadaceae bacterium]|nr:diguanylate cyclase [Selenomonadaceae bacterium]
MKQRVYHFILSAVFFYALFSYGKDVLVIPPKIIDLSPFLPPILGLMWGTPAAFGVAIGDLLSHYPSFQLKEALAVFFAGYFPYKVWHSVWTDETAFAFNSKNLIKFIAIIFVSTLSTSLFLGLTTTEREVKTLFEGTDLPLSQPIDYAGILFLNDFDVAIFFGMPLFLILVSYNYDFHLPTANKIVQSESVSKMNRLALIVLYGLFLVLFITLDVSGIIYDLDHMDNWLQFNGEILTMMNITLIVMFLMLLKYRRSIMTNLMLLEMATVFIAALMLGSVSFMAISGTIDDHVDNDLQKMSVIYRERLSHTFNDMRMAVNSMGSLALSELESYERLRNDEAYRNNYLTAMERSFTAITEKTAGSIGFYMRFSPDIVDAGFLCTRLPTDWGRKLPTFTHMSNPHHNDRYHIPQERYLAQLSEPYMNESIWHYMISYVIPLQKDDRFIGIVGMDIDFDYIIHEIKRMSVYEHGYVCLLNKKGDILYANHNSKEAFENKKGVYETETYLSNGIWLKIAAFSHDIYADRNNMLIRFVVVMLFVVILVSIFSIWLAEREIKPLILITEAARKIADGDLDVKISYKAQNELGTLVDSIKDMVAKLEVYMYRDKLTGVLNTAAYIRKVNELEKHRRNTDTNPYAIAVFDVNFLKRLNDKYGHEAGNELIRRAAKLIGRIFSNSRVYRIGGDEFVAILTDKDYEDRERLLQQFDSETANESFMVDEQEIKVSIARGMALCNKSEEFSEIFRQADAAMYENKSAIKAKLGIVGR